MNDRQLERLKDVQRAHTEHVKSVATGSSSSAIEQIAAAESVMNSATLAQTETRQLKARVLAAG